MDIDFRAARRQGQMAKRKTARVERTDGTMAFSELSSTDPVATRNFLEKVFTWRFESTKFPLGEYLSFQAPGGGPRRHPSRPGEGDPGKHELRPRGGSGCRVPQDRASRRDDRPAAGRHPGDGEFLLVPHPRRTDLGSVAGRSGAAGGG